MPRGRKQANIRNYNQQQVIKLISAKSCSCNDIAKALKMSNSTIEDIVDELSKIGIIKISSTKAPKTVGRSPIYYKLNKDFGCILAVDLINSKFEVCDLCYGVLISSNFTIGGSFDVGHRYHLEDIMQIISQIKASLTSEFLQKWKLRAICVATFGKLNIETGEFVWVSSIDKEINLKQIFTEQFNIPTVVYNDGHLSAIAESEFGKLKNKTKNSLYITVGEGIVNTLFIDDKIVYGYDYRSGEIGFANCYSEFVKEYRQLDEIMTIPSIKKNIKRFLENNPNVYSLIRNEENVSNLFKYYLQEDTVCVDAVLDSANCLGKILSILINILNCQTIVIAGEVARFGDRYLNTINQTINNNLSIKYRVEAEFSTIENSTILGAKIQGVNLAIKSNLRETN